jgi:hypothetical protein
MTANHQDALRMLLLAISEDVNEPSHRQNLAKELLSALPADVSTQSTGQSDREAFEEWAIPRFLYVTKRPDGEYASGATHEAWCAWQDRVALTALQYAKAKCQHLNSVTQHTEDGTPVEFCRDCGTNRLTTAQPAATAEYYLRGRYGAYRGHHAWRELEEAFNAGMAAQPADRLAQLEQWVDATGAISKHSSWYGELQAIVAGRGEPSDKPEGKAEQHFRTMEEISKEPGAGMTNIPTTAGDIKARLEAALWEFIHVAGANPDVKPDDRIWGHVLAYSPHYSVVFGKAEQAVPLAQQLHAALLSVNAVAIERGDKFGACDQIDNDGQPYQSQWLADLLANTPAQSHQDEQVVRNEALEQAIAEARQVASMLEDIQYRGGMEAACELIEERLKTNQEHTDRELLDSDGENLAVRTFLQLYGGTNSPSIEGMRDHLAMSGFDDCWPDWAATEYGFLTKAGAQSWLRYLFALENRAAQIEKDLP